MAFDLEKVEKGLPRKLGQRGKSGSMKIQLLLPNGPTSQKLIKE